MPVFLLLRRAFDIAIIVALAVTAWRLLHVMRPEAETPEAVTVSSIKLGDTLRVPGLSLARNRTVVLVLRSSCPACNANLPYYERLSLLASADVEMVVLTTEPEADARRWLRDNQVQVNRIIRTEPSAHGLTLTPIIMIVDRQGLVSDIAIRQLDRDQQDAVIGRVRHKDLYAAFDNSQQIGEISEGQFSALEAGSVQLLDVRPRELFKRSHQLNARNIPVNELAARATVELDASVPTVVDCAQPRSAGCRSAAWILIDAGFTNVALMLR